MNTQTVYDIIIPVYNGYDFLFPLFSSIKNGTTDLHRLIIINDCSPDPRIAEFLKTIETYKNEFCKEIILHHNSQNLGFVKSVNLGYKFTKNNFVILNTDTEVPYRWLERLMHKMEVDHSIASITPLTNAGTICSFPVWLEDNSLAFELPLDKIDNVFNEINDQELIEVPTGVGFCMALNKRVVEKIGLFDEDNFGKGYGEENDWCMRAKMAGYKNIIIRNLYVYHKHGGSFGGEKVALIEKHSKILLAKHPTYNTEVSRFISQHVMDALFAEASLRMFLLHNPAIIFCHFWGGGSDHFIHEHLLNDTNNNYQILIRGSGSNVVENIELISNRTSIFKITIKSLEKILSILSTSENKTYYLNHLININELPSNFSLLADFFIDNNIKPIYYLHDYFLICPTINLLNDKKAYCGIPEKLDICNNCLQNNKDFLYIPLPKPLQIEDWRSSTNRILSQCSVIYSFSNTSSKLLIKAFPNIEDKLRLYKLTLPTTRAIINKPNFSENKILNIGLLGVIQYMKGLEIAQNLAKEIIRLSLPLKITVVGPETGYIVDADVTGEYKKENLPEICKDKKIDLFIVPSIWPETYCYTADEIMSMGYPVVCFDIGAPAERISRYEHGLVVKGSNTASNLLNGVIFLSRRYGFQIKKTAKFNIRRFTITAKEFYYNLKKLKKKS